MFVMMTNDYLKEIENMTKRVEAIDLEINNFKIVKEEQKQGLEEMNATLKK